ncbi:GAF and ANTAR domain-containing protein [Kineococcus sp. SYSU DK006]|uniref:GAF and ANTAR domain-containing protein n=1 Tax=Kineococcus sp. SYSU DK006 TaxID=3383127 RepID=UPI003D7D97AA
MSLLTDRFSAAWSEEAESADPALLPSALARACARVLPFDAAGLGLVGGPGARVPLGASDDDAAEAERLQFTHGDGPCSLALREGRPVVVTEEKWLERWPVLAREHFARTPFRGGLSLALRTGPARIGVLDLYSRTSRPLDGATIIDGQAIAAVVTSVLHRTLGSPSPAPGGAVDEDLQEPVRTSSPGARRRRQVWLAVGMAHLVLGLPGEEALAVLRAHAYAGGRTLDDLADDVVHGRLDLERLRSEELR